MLKRQTIVKQRCSSRANLRLNMELNVTVALCICDRYQKKSAGKSVAVEAKLGLTLEANFAKFH